MKVTISVGGKFHAFTLAKELEKRGYLEKIFTSYSWPHVKKIGLAQTKVKCLILKEVFERSLNKIPFLNRKIDVSFYMSNLFDMLVSHLIKPCDIFVGWSGFSLFTMRQLRKSSTAILIIERGSSHIEFQYDILTEEAKRTGVRLTLPSLHTIKKELEEYKEADYISVPSNFVKQTFIAKGIPEDKVIQIPYGVNSEIFHPVFKKDGAFRIIVVGICLRKGIHYLLSAIGGVKLKSFEVWLIGKISDEVRPLLKKIPENWKCWGNIPHEELYRYYSQGSLFVLPSIEDGFGLTILEAMACQLPVICTSNAGGSEIINDNKEGFVIPIRDAKILKEKIIYLYENQQKCKEMGENARRKITTDFTQHHYGEKIIRTYLNLLNKSKTVI